MYLDQLSFLPKEKEEIILAHGYKIVTFEEKPHFDPYYDKMNDWWSSPMSFMAMIAWETALKFYYKEVGEYLVCLGWDATIGKMTVLPFLGKYENKTLAEAFQIVREELDEMGYPLCITDMREWMQPYYDAIPGTSWEKTESDTLSDYVYAAAEFDHFHGKSGQYHRYFLKNYNYSVEEVTPSHLPVITDFIREIWCSHTDCSACNYGCPIDCISKVLPCLKELSGFGILVRVEGRVAGYCIGSVHNGMAIYHFQNTREEYRGIGMFMYHEIRTRMLPHVSIISLGEDMGLPGIRTFKTRLAPHEWIPRFEYALMT